MSPKEQYNQAIYKIEEAFSPLCIFLYGSQARGDATQKSDYELGVVENENYPISRESLHLLIKNYTMVHAYPFRLLELQSGKPNIPFQKSLWINEILKVAKTVYGENIFKKIPPPPIKVSDLLESASFNTGVAFMSALIHRTGEIDLATDYFAKSCLFSAQLLIILKKREFILDFESIFREAIKFEMEEKYKDVLQHAIRTRRTEEALREGVLYTNMSFISEVVKKNILEYLERSGDKILLQL